MNQQTLLNDLLAESYATSKFEERRNYVSLSNIIKPVDDLVSDYVNGQTCDNAGRLKCRMGYWMERGLMERVLKLQYAQMGYEIVVPSSNNLIKGHPDFKYAKCPGDCKSFLLDEYLPDERKIPKKIYWQMNAYMLYDDADRSFLVCESRQSGMIKVITIRRNESVCNAIDEKCQLIINALQSIAA